MHQNNAARGAKEVSEAKQMNTLHTFYSAKITFRLHQVISLSDIVLNWFYALACFAYFHCIIEAGERASEKERTTFWNILAQSIKQLLEDMRGILLVLLLHRHNLYFRSETLLSIFQSISEANQAWNKHEAWVCQADKNYLRGLNWTTILLDHNDYIKSRREIYKPSTKNFQPLMRRFNDSGEKMNKQADFVNYHLGNLHQRTREYQSNRNVISTISCRDGF